MMRTFVEWVLPAALVFIIFFALGVWMGQWEWALVAILATCAVWGLLLWASDRKRVDDE